MKQKREQGLMEKLDSGKDYYEIRLESIGGLGANLCGKMLGELGLKYLGLNSSCFSSYGSEKTGTPVKGYIRYCRNDKELRLHSPVTEPDLLVIFHQALISDESIWKGCSEETCVIFAMEGSQERLLNYPGITYGVEAQKIAMETHSRINVVMLGAALRVMGIQDSEAGEKICQDTLGSKYPEALAGNLAGLRRGYEEVRRLREKSRTEEEIKGCCDAADRQEYRKEHGGKQTVWGYANAPIGGVNPRYGSSVAVDLSPSRQGYFPIFRKEKCIHCGLCSSTCPDMVFQFKKEIEQGREVMKNKGLDYYHCKGCLRCVEVCPVGALVKGIEAEHPEKEGFLPNQELLRMPGYYEKAGADGYVTSESYLTEKRMEGGEV